MDAKYLITSLNSKKSSFLLEDGHLVKGCPLCNESLLGNVYTAKVVNVVKSINAAFVDAGTGDYMYYPLAENQDSTIFLKHGKSEKVCIGDEILVQINKDPIKTKKGEATSDINLRGSYIVINRSGYVGVSAKIKDGDIKKELKGSVEKLLLKYDYLRAGAIIRTSAENVSIENVLKEGEVLLKRMKDILASAEFMTAKQLVYSADNGYASEIMDILSKDKYENFEVITDDEGIYNELKDHIDIQFFDDNMTNLGLVYNIQRDIEKLMNRQVYLKSGGSIIVEPTEAMTVIDVNTGKAIKGKDTENTFLKINKEAAEMIARVLRFRNLSGIIMIDFINMKEAESVGELISYLKYVLSKDEVKVTYVDMTALGLVELTRRKQSRGYKINDFI